MNLFYRLLISICINNCVYSQIHIKSTYLRTHAFCNFVNLGCKDIKSFPVFLFWYYFSRTICWSFLYLQIVIIGTIMWQKIGISVFVGIGSLLIIALAVQGTFSLLSRRIRALIAPLTDRRVQLMSELVAGIQVSPGYLISYFTLEWWVKTLTFKSTWNIVSSSTRKQLCEKQIYKMALVSGGEDVRLGETIQQDRVGDQRARDQED